ncbi:MAG TPA: hypothetical protein VF765_20835 [Polyangiaceae bacterium]
MSGRWLGVLACTVAAGGAGLHACARGESWPGPKGVPAPTVPVPSAPAPEETLGSLQLEHERGTHPRILLTADRLAAVRGLHDAGAPSWRALVDRCDEFTRTKIDSGYQAWDWANAALDLALCHRITKRPAYAQAGVDYLRALLDDGEKVGDHAGGDDVVRHDDGYPIRTRGCFGAIAYDWLHDAPGMTDELRKHVVDRMVAWTRWFGTDGYNHDQPISNYYVGYFGAVAFAGIASQGDDPRATDLLRRAQRMFDAEIVPAYTRKLAGGDFPEGWQYGDMVGAVLAIFADAEGNRGGRSALEELPWLRQSVALRAHTLLPDGKHMLDSGDWSDKPAVAPAHALLALTAVLPASDAAEHQASALAKLAADPQEDWNWLVALADDPSRIVQDPRTGETAYLARGTGTMTARTDWSPRAVWVSMSSGPALADHQHLDAGHFEIVRGGDALVVDGGGYGSFSSLSHNVIAVDDGKEVDPYSPSQGTWGTSTSIARWEDERGWSYGLADYASAYDPEGYPSETTRRSVRRAERELVFSRAPIAGAPESARVVVYDRITVNRPTYRVTFLLHGGALPHVDGPGLLRVDVGSSVAFAQTLAPSDAVPALVREPTNLGDGAFYDNDPPDGVTSVRAEVRSPVGNAERRFLHAIVVGPSKMRPPVLERIEGQEVAGAVIGDEAYVFVRSAPQTRAASLDYRAPTSATRHLVASLAPNARYAVEVERDGDACHVSLEPGEGKTASRAGVLEVDLAAGCALR